MKELSVSERIEVTFAYSEYDYEGWTATCSDKSPGGYVYGNGYGKTVELAAINLAHSMGVIAFYNELPRPQTTEAMQRIAELTGEANEDIRRGLVDEMVKLMLQIGWKPPEKEEAG
jgi:hypothetical protein